MQFKLNGVELPAVDDMKVGEVCEAEKALGLALDETGMGGKVAVMLYVALRRDDKDKPIGVLADEVLRSEMKGLDLVEEADAGPPVEAPAGPGLEAPLTSGHLRSAS